MKQILLISGKAGSGKDLVASMLPGWKRVAFADILKDQVSSEFDIDRLSLDTQAGKAEVNHLGITNRRLLINYGTFKRSRDVNYWVKGVRYLITDNNWENIVIPDFRFPNEFEYLKKRLPKSEYVIKTLLIDRNSCIRINDPTETSLVDFNFNFTIHNNSSIEELKKKVSSFSMDNF